MIKHGVYILDNCRLTLELVCFLLQVNGPITGLGF